MPNISISQFKRAVVAAEKARAKRASNLLGTVAARSPKLLNSRLASEKLLTEQFAKTGLDVRKFNRAQKEDRRELRQILDKEHADAAKRSSKMKKTLRLAADSRLDALRYVPNGAMPHALPNVTTLDTPFLIWAAPHSNIIWDSLIDPGHSWAKIKVVGEKSWSSEKLSFYYLWDNPTDYHAIINVSTYLSLHGYCRALVEGGIWSGISVHDNDVRLGLSCGLTLWEWWNQPPTLSPYYPSQDQHAYQSILQYIMDGGFWEDSKSEVVLNGYNLNQNLFVIPPRGVVVAEVWMAVSYSISGGHILADFASEDWRIMNHYLQVALLTAPPMTVTPAAAVTM